jgi:hypothetical protein
MIHAYFSVNSLAFFSNAFLSFLYNCAISGTKGSSGFGLSKSEDIHSSTLISVSAGLH